MYLSFYNFLNDNWIYIVLSCLAILILGVFVLFIYYKFIQKDRRFKDDLLSARVEEFTIVINYEEKIVEKYYMYSQKNHHETMLLDEFFVKFDNANFTKLSNWLKRISLNINYDVTRRIQIVMYDNKGSRSIYIVTLENYNEEANRFYLHFKDISSAEEVIRRKDDRVILNNINEFFDLANERIDISDDNSINYLLVIKYKEHESYIKNFNKATIRRIDRETYFAIDSLKNDNDLICLYNSGIILLLTSNVVNVKLYKRKIKNILLKVSSKSKNVDKGLSFTTTLFAGYTSINKDEQVSYDKVFEAEASCDSLLTKHKNMSLERIQLYDDNIRKASDISKNKMLIIEKIIEKKLFSINYTPIVEVKTKSVKSYSVEYRLLSNINIELEEFFKLIKDSSYSKLFYQKVFEIFLESKKQEALYLTFDYEELSSVMEAYASNEEFLKLNIYFCMSFSSVTLQNNDLISIEKNLRNCEKYNNVKLGINYNTLNKVYLNDKIYKKADVIILSNSLIDHCLDTYENSTLIALYIKLAATYSQEVIGLNVKNLALYEMLVHKGVLKIGGPYFNSLITINNKIEDKALLKTLSEIENKKY